MLVQEMLTSRHAFTCACICTMNFSRRHPSVLIASLLAQLDDAKRSRGTRSSHFSRPPSYYPLKSTDSPKCSSDFKHVVRVLYTNFKSGPKEYIAYSGKVGDLRRRHLPALQLHVTTFACRLLFQFSPAAFFVYFHT